MQGAMTVSYITLSKNSNENRIAYYAFRGPAAASAAFARPRQGEGEGRPGSVGKLDSFAETLREIHFKLLVLIDFDSWHEDCFCVGSGRNEPQSVELGGAYV